MPIAPGVLFQPQPTSRIFGECDASIKQFVKLFGLDEFNYETLRAPWRSMISRVGSDKLASYPVGKITKVKGVNWHLDLRLQLRKSHTVQHHRFVTLERDL